ncbi:hypothetical protein BBJ29_007055 [Phytophthora kernoviae]|uniref:Uncharacterized protein n=1 Tax=Phytophthora kernoviae TaxID=325452 RepID=A0A3F2RI33_9STRA|nr:hypothetical protein BBJ29_007055 [Phytophthora kernoviae]RLN57470.1 hypothetical protein BBP00_00007487 [Phytophthora kernoviae]
MAPTKRLNLSKSRDDNESSSASSTDDEQDQTQQQTKEQEQEEDSSSGEESDEEFEIPPDFKSVKGSAAVTRESVLSSGQELWFFKLPKNLNASALENVTIKIAEGKKVTPGEQLAKLTAGEDKKKYVLQSEDGMLTDQLVNALPLASDRARFVLGKPFSRCFSLVEDHQDAAVAAVASSKTQEVEASPVVEKRKKKSSSDKHHKSKKAKHKK